MNTTIRSILSNRKVVALSAAAVGFVTGGVVGTLVTRRLFVNAMIDELDNEEHDRKMERLQRRMDPNFVVWDKIKGPDVVAVDKWDQAVIAGTDPELERLLDEEEAEAEARRRREAARHNTFDTPNDDWDYEGEYISRSTKEIYIIHRDEYVRDEMGYHQSTIEFYTQDGVMTDALQHPIYNYTDFVGHEALDQFGHGSGDANVVYVRNEREKAEFEVLQNESSYELEVLGMSVEGEYSEDDLKHSKYPTHRFPIRE